MKTMGVTVLIVGAISLCGQARSELMVFDNTGWGFGWDRSFNIGSGVGQQRRDGLDITMPATQSGGMTDHSMVYVGYEPFTSNQITESVILRETANVRIAQSDTTIFIPGANSSSITVRPARSYEMGSAVGPAAMWGNQGTVGWFSFAQGGEHRLLGDQAVVGVELNISGQLHYGWIWLQWDSVTTVGNRLQYRPTMWAYETEANTPALVTIPAPGAAGALVMCAGIAGIRRRAR